MLYKKYTIGIDTLCMPIFFSHFSSGEAECLLDSPNKNILTNDMSSTQPGEMFEVNRQCELEFGMGFKKCSFSYLVGDECTLLIALFTKRNIHFSASL